MRGPFNVCTWSVQSPFNSHLTFVFIKRSSVKWTVHRRGFLAHTVRICIAFFSAMVYIRIHSASMYVSCITSLKDTRHQLSLGFSKKKSYRLLEKALLSFSENTRKRKCTKNTRIKTRSKVTAETKELFGAKMHEEDDKMMAHQLHTLLQQCGFDISLCTMLVELGWNHCLAAAG